ncbi:excinuclease [Pseudomonas caspiana]|uniref:Excinuclease n=1 Tax=Pseudomonas caspiana TaxID=1451454 RepID=A0A1Y3P605_9PSED|nr:excinuclease [Pseudomonas caspiana]OUM72234.1 excinuclease [Pseudomonas caspiana]
MQMKSWIAAAAIALSVLPAVSQARDTALFLPFQKVINDMTAAGKIDGSVKFYLAGVPPKGKVTVVSPGAVTNKKTNAFNKTDTEACEWVLQSAILQMYGAAKNANANAVTNITSYYKSIERKDPVNYECHAGAIIAGVALKGDLSKVD